MQPPHQLQRINVAKLKAQIVKKLGPEGSKQYFTYLNMFLNLKLSKVEFNRLCLRIIGRENVPLHNQFIHSILKNACSAKVPPQAQDNEVQNSDRTVGSKETSRDVHKQNMPNPSILSNGEILPLPHKARMGTRDRKILDHLSPFGPNGKTNFVLDISLSENDANGNVDLENGHLTPLDIQRPLQHHQGVKDQANYWPNSSSVQRRLTDGSVSAHSKDKIEAVGFENRKEIATRSMLHAPLGLPCCPVSVGGARRTIPLPSDSKCISSFNAGGLLDSGTLRDRMEQIAISEGLEGVSMDCANLLNNGLDTYLGGLIASCIELVGARSGHAPMKVGAHTHQARVKFANGVRLNHHSHMHCNSGPVEGIQERRPHHPLSLLDFRVAMELNPEQLGEDWPLLLEKICTHTYDE